MRDLLPAPRSAPPTTSCGSLARVATAIAWGFLCHGLFAAAIGVTVLALHGGLLCGRGRLEGVSAALANGALLVQFPLLHSFLLSSRGQGVLARCAPFRLGRDLAPTTFGIAASLQLLAAFGLWSPSGVTLLEICGAARAPFEIAFAASWAFLAASLANAGLGLQTGFIGWNAVLRGKRPRFRPFPTHGLFRACRQPVYLAFALTLWTGPVLTLDRIVLAVAWTAYCLVGPLFKERRYLKRFGDAYRNYQAQVPYMLPGRPGRRELADRANCLRPRRRAPTSR